MATNKTGISCEEVEFQRQEWPYGSRIRIGEEDRELLWLDSLEWDVSHSSEEHECVPLRTEEGEEHIHVPLFPIHNSSEATAYKPPHWTKELGTVISESCPINTLIRASALPNVSETAEAQQMKDVLMPMMEATLKELTALYKLFHGSRLLLVGSMTENTKVGKADEFDFAVILPVLAQKEYHRLFLDYGDDEYNGYVPDPAVVSLLGENWGADNVFANDFPRLVKEMWCKQMMEHVPPGWEVLNPSGHLYKRSVAATFHLQHQNDNTVINLDVCFLIPLDKESLFETEFSSLHYIAQHCRHYLDEKGFVYVVLEVLLSSVDDLRFAMSGFEKHALNKYGADNGRIQCYRTCKCLVSALLPKVKKENDCDYCFDGLVSSFCLKNIILYMAAYYTDDAFWTREKLPNRVLEVFIILNQCIHKSCSQVYAYFTNYKLSFQLDKYNPSSKCMSFHKACVLPDLTKIKEQFTEDPISQTAVADFQQFLRSTEWCCPEVICRVTALLTNLMQEDEEDLSLKTANKRMKRHVRNWWKTSAGLSLMMSLTLLMLVILLKQFESISDAE